MPSLKPKATIANSSSTQLSTRNQTLSANSARSSESCSINGLNSQDSSDLSLGEDKSVHMSAALEAALFSMSPSELMQFRWLKQLQSSIPSVDLDDVNTVLENPQAAR